MEDQDPDKKENDPDEEEIRKSCAAIRKGWSSSQRKSRAVYKQEEYTISIIKFTDIEGDYN